MLRMIPKKLLIHSVTHRYGRTLDAWQKETFSGSRIIKFVRVESSAARKWSKDSEEIPARSLMFYDSRASEPHGAAFLPNDIIVFDGREYRVSYVDRVYGDSKQLHHIEVGLI